MALAEELRKAVLLSAISGKLSEHLETDGYADSILHQIQMEHPQNKPINLDEPIFDIPENWCWCSLSELGEFSSGKTPDKSNSSYWENGTEQWFTSKDMKSKYLSDSILKITSKAKEQMSVYPAGTLLMVVRSGILKHSLPVCVLTVDATINQDIKAYKLYNEELSEYLYIMLKGLETHILQNYTKRITTVDSLKFDEFSQNMPIPLPPIGEQQRIVERVKELMQQIDEYAKIEQRLISLKDSFPSNLRFAVLQAAMQGKLTEQNIDSEKSPMDYIVDDKNDLLKKHLIKKDKRLFIDDEIEELPYDIPDNWQWTFLGNILQKLTDGTHRTPKYSDIGVKFISVKDMSSGKICFENTKYITVEEHKELYKRCDPKRGDMLLSKVGTTGVPAFVDTDEEFSLFVSVALLRFNHEYILPRFLYYLIYSPLVQWQATENTKGVGNQNWVLDKIARTLIVLPPVEEQGRIVERLDALLPYCENIVEG